MGDLRDNEGRVEVWATVEMLSDSLGLTARDASILIGDLCTVDRDELCASSNPAHVALDQQEL